MKDEKYITFKREDFYQMMGKLALPPYGPDDALIGGDLDCAPIAQEIIEVCEATALADATVIRGQDQFAGPALHTYAAMISIAARLGVSSPFADDQLQIVADYFSARAMQADELFADGQAKRPD